MTRRLLPPVLPRGCNPSALRRPALYQSGLVFRQGVVDVDQNTSVAAVAGLDVVGFNSPPSRQVQPVAALPPARIAPWP